MITKQQFNTTPTLDLSSYDFDDNTFYYTKIMNVHRISSTGTSMMVVSRIYF